MSMQYGGRLKNCLGKVYSHRHEIADRFYELLFDERPDLAEMFSGDFRKQKEMFSMMVSMLARATATGADIELMGREIRQQHKHLNVSTALYIRSGFLLRQAFLDIIDDQIGDFEKVLLTESISRLTTSAAGLASEEEPGPVPDPPTFWV